MIDAGTLALWIVLALVAFLFGRWCVRRFLSFDTYGDRR